MQKFRKQKAIHLKEAAQAYLVRDPRDCVSHRAPAPVSHGVLRQQPHACERRNLHLQSLSKPFQGLIAESLLGLRLEVNQLRFEPCIPAAWRSFKMHYRYRETVYHIEIVQGAEAAGITVDGEAHEGDAIPLVDDRREHSVEVRLKKA